MVFVILDLIELTSGVLLLQMAVFNVKSYYLSFPRRVKFSAFNYRGYESIKIGKIQASIA